MIRQNGVLLCLVPLLMLPARNVAAQTETKPFVHNGYSRPYLLHRPAHVAAHPAVVFMLAGIGSTAEFASENFKWIEESDRYGFLVVFPEPVPTQTDQPMDRHNNITFWEMKGSRTHRLANGALPVDDDGYLMAVLNEVVQQEHADKARVFFAGFSSGSGAVQLLASRHSQQIRGVVAVATPLMDPPLNLAHPVPILYIHGDNDQQFSGFEVNSPHFCHHSSWQLGHMGLPQRLPNSDRREKGLGCRVFLAALQPKCACGRGLRCQLRPRMGGECGLERHQHARFHRAGLAVLFHDPLEIKLRLC